MAAGMLKGSEVVTGHSSEDERMGLQRNDIPPPISEHKLRRYSSCEKLLVGDSLNVAKNDKIARMMMRNGKIQIQNHHELYADFGIMEVLKTSKI